MFTRMCLVFMGALSLIANAAFAQPERFVDRASDHPAEVTKTAVTKKKQAAKAKVSRLTQEAASDENAEAPAKKPVGVRAPNGLR